MSAVLALQCSSFEIIVCSTLETYFFFIDACQTDVVGIVTSHFTWLARGAVLYLVIFSPIMRFLAVKSDFASANMYIPGIWD